MFQMDVHVLWGKRIRQVKRMLKRWMLQEKENNECEVYDDLRILKRHYLRPAVKLYNELSQQEFVRNSDIIALNIKTEQLVLAFNKLTADYSDPPVAEPDDMVTAMVDQQFLRNLQV